MANAFDQDPLIKTADLIGAALGRIVRTGKLVADVADQTQKDCAYVARDISTISSCAVNYFQSHSASEIAADSERVAKRYPRQALTIAVAAGFVIERLLIRAARTRG